MEKLAVIIALTLSVLLTAFGAVILVYPEFLAGFVRILYATSALYIDAVFRVVFGAALYFAAPVSRASSVLRALGVLVLASGLARSALGVDAFQSIIQWKLNVYGGVFIAVGLIVWGAWLTYALIYGLTPRSSAPSSLDHELSSKP